MDKKQFKQRKNRETRKKSQWKKLKKSQDAIRKEEQQETIKSSLKRYIENIIIEYRKMVLEVSNKKPIKIYYALDKTIFEKKKKINPIMLNRAETWTNYPKETN